jgi:O-antigen ligase
VSEQPEPTEPAPEGPSFVNWMGSLWGYTILRFGMFFALWGILVLVGLGGLLAALIALVLSIPLALVLLSGPRNRVAQNLEQRVDAHRAQRAELDSRLDPEPHDD